MADPKQLLSEYIEVESGKNNHRPQLLAAIAEARQVGATLLIVKVDRLSRNAGFIFTLRDAGCDKCALLVAVPARGERPTRQAGRSPGPRAKCDDQGKPHGCGSCFGNEC